MGVAEEKAEEDLKTLSFDILWGRSMLVLWTSKSSDDISKRFQQ